MMTGGTDEFAGAQGSGTLTGTLNHLPLLVGRPAMLGGSTRLTIAVTHSP